jgi:hypothetical protein
MYAFWCCGNVCACLSAHTDTQQSSSRTPSLDRQKGEEKKPSQRKREGNPSSSICQSLFGFPVVLVGLSRGFYIYTHVHIYIYISELITHIKNIKIERKETRRGISSSNPFQSVEKMTRRGKDKRKRDIFSSSSRLKASTRALWVLWVLLCAFLNLIHRLIPS